MLDAWTDQPAFVLGRRGDVLATNALARALLAVFDAMPYRDRNLTKWLLLDPRGQRPVHRLRFRSPPRSSPSSALTPRPAPTTRAHRSVSESPWVAEFPLVVPAQGPGRTWDTTLPAVRSSAPRNRLRGAPPTWRHGPDAVRLPRTGRRHRLRRSTRPARQLERPSHTRQQPTDPHIRTAGCAMRPSMHNGAPLIRPG